MSRPKTKHILVVFALMVVCAVTTLWLQNGGAVQNTNPRKEVLRIVEVTHDGSYFYAGTKMDLNEVETALVQAFRKNSKMAVAIRADTNEDYGNVMKVLSVCQRNGIFKIGLSTKNN
jgi:biopolymer transport protein ExbD